MTSSMNADIHAAVDVDEATLAIHANAERFDKVGRHGRHSSARAVR